MLVQFSSLRKRGKVHPASCQWSSAVSGSISCLCKDVKVGISRLIIFLPVLCSLVVTETAKSDDIYTAEEKILAFLEKENRVETGKSCIPQGSFHIRVKVEDFATMTSAELADLKRKIAEKPDHPDHEKVKTEERRRNKGPDVTRYEWWRDGGRIRMNITYYDGSYYDCAYDSKSSWVLSPGHLLLENIQGSVDDIGSYGQERFPPNIRLSGFVHALRSCAPTANGCYADLGVINSPIASINKTDNDSYEIIRYTLNKGEKKKYAPDLKGKYWQKIKLRWDDSLHCVIVERVNTYIPGNIPYSTLTYGEVKPCPLPFVIQSPMKFYDSRNVLKRKVSVELCEKSSPKMVADLVKEPSLDGKDPVRGKYTYIGVTDLRPGKEEYLDLTDKKQPVTLPLPEIYKKKHTSNAFRVVGWITAAGIVIILVYLRLKSRVR